jgi:hypothetical protein
MLPDDGGASTEASHGNNRRPKGHGDHAGDPSRPTTTDDHDAGLAVESGADQRVAQASRQARTMT